MSARAQTDSPLVTPDLARRVLRSASENGDLITDLDRFACQLAVSLRTNVTRDYARAIARDNGGLEFDDEGWVR
jgi:hypothetical protein